MSQPIKTALLPLQMAVYDRLSTDPGLNQFVEEVYDHIPQSAKLPFVAIGDDTSNPYDSKTTKGEELTITIDAWSAGPGKTEAKQIMDAVLYALTRDPLEIAGFDCEGIEREFLEVFRDETVYHGICRFRVYTKQL